MDETAPIAEAEVFNRLNGRRRAVRKFDGIPIPDAVLRAIAGEAQLAPSSRNTQPYRFLCVRSPQLVAALAPFCNDQAAARSAAALVVVVAGKRLARETLDAWGRHLAVCELDERSLAYHRKELRKSRLFLTIGSWPIWSALVAALQTIQPAASLLPVGGVGVRHWTSRNAIFAAQTFLLAASAHGVDTCPMEGFNAVKLRKALGLPPDVVIPLVIALGHAAADARLEPRWRKPLDEALILL
ncbi:MAG: nitroreductase family protein [Sphingomonas sp.]